MGERKAGRELDLEVAVKVLGLLKHEGCDTEPDHDDDENPWKPEFCVGTYQDGYTQAEHYSTDIAAAWQVVEQLRAQVGIVIAVYEDGSCRVDTSRLRLSYDVSNQVTLAPTVPLGICIAALAAVTREEAGPAMSDKVPTVTFHCACGGSTSVSGPQREQIIADIRRQHVGTGHRETTARVAAAARRKAERLSVELSAMERPT